MPTAELEIRLLPRQDDSYPVELRLQEPAFERCFRGRLDRNGLLPWQPGPEPQEDGRRLFEAVFADPEPREAWAELRMRSPLRLRLRIAPEAVELHALPWELLHDARDSAGQDVAASARTPFSRYVPSRHGLAEPVQGLRARCLVAVANPKGVSGRGLAPIDAAAEVEAIRRAQEEVPARRLEIEMLEGVVTLRVLGEALGRGFDVLHLAAHGVWHGDEPCLLLKDAQGEMCEVGAKALAELFERLPPACRPRLVVLAACETGRVTARAPFGAFAQALLGAGVAAVVAMGGEPAGEAVRAFAEILYKGLMDHGRLDRACNEARAGLLTSRFPEASVPILASRLRDGRLLLPLPNTPDQATALRLLEQVRATGGLADTEPIAFELCERGGWIARPLEGLLGLPEPADRPLPYGLSLLGQLQQAGGSLLLLGVGDLSSEALRELAREAMAAAWPGDLLVPVGLDLSRWTPNDPWDFEHWMLDELVRAYAVAVTDLQDTLAAGRLLLLLDGLGDLPQAVRGACITAINDFWKTHGKARIAVAYGVAGPPAEGEPWLRLGKAIEVSLGARPARAARSDLHLRVLPTAGATCAAELRVDGWPKVELARLSETPTAGTDLFEWLFPDGPLRRAWLEARAHSRHLTFRLEIDPALSKLELLPWEALVDMTHPPPRPLASAADVTFLRYAPGPAMPPPPSLRYSLRVLQVLGHGCDRGLENQRLEHAFFGLDPARLIFENRDGLAVSSLEALERVLRARRPPAGERLHVAHVVGRSLLSQRHQTICWMLEDEHGDAVPIEAQELSGLLGRLAPEQRPLLMLLADPSHGVESPPDARLELAHGLLRAGIAAVVGLPSAPEQLTSPWLAIFFHSLLKTGRIDAAVAQGNAQLIAMDPRAPLPWLISRATDLKLIPTPIWENSPENDALRLAGVVQRHWIDGVLDRRLAEVGWIGIDRQLSEPQVEEGSPTSKETEIGDRSLGDILQERRRLLILGEAGGGKSFTLLQLIRDLLLNLERDEGRLAVPVVFNLSTWPGAHVPLVVWLVDELQLRYGVSSQLARSLLEDGSHRIVPLLDGLDEVPEARRVDCLVAVNDLLEPRNAPLLIAVCCRTQTYTDLERRFGVGLRKLAVLELRPPSQSQIERYLSAAGSELDAVRLQIREDASLRELAERPALLSLMSIAYRGKSEAELASIRGAEAHRGHLFESYLENRFQRIVRTKKEPFPTATVRKGLGWLAAQMRQHGTTSFLLEEMQPSWLQTQPKLYGILCRCLMALGLGVPMGTFFGLYVGLVLGVQDELHLSMSQDPFSQTYEHVWANAAGILPWVVTSVLIFLVLGLMLAESVDRSVGTKIESVERLRWSLKTALKAPLRHALPAVSIGLPLGGLFSVVAYSIEGTEAALFFGLFFTLVVAVTFWTILLFLGGFGDSALKIERKIKPNQGIWESGFNSVGIWVTGCVVGPFGGILGFSLALPIFVTIGIFFFPTESSSRAGPALLPLLLFLFLFGAVVCGGIFGLFAGQLAGTYAALRQGGLAFLRHFVLRFLLWRKGRLPCWNYARFLDHAYDLGLLDKVGGGYQFPYSSFLLEQFAAEHERTLTKQTGPL